jgi:DNA-directed RNA polymerase specialized sigma subunit
VSRIYRQTGQVNEIKEPTKPYKKPGWYKKTERLLKYYKNLPMEIDNLKLQLRMDQLVGQSITQQFKPVVIQHNSVSSPLESVTIKEESMEERIERKEIMFIMISNAIKTFNPEEKMIYQLRYELEKREKEVYTKLQMSRSSYFELQKRVVLKTAKLLGIPVPEAEQPEEWKGKLFEGIPWATP